MDLAEKILTLRKSRNWTQDQLAEQLDISRQTISNWENEKSYPDIVSVVRLSDLYSISLDDLLKGDAKMLEHLEECTDVVKSNQKLILAVAANIVVFLACLLMVAFLPESVFMVACVFCLAVVSVAFLLYQIVKRI